MQKQLGEHATISDLATYDVTSGRDAFQLTAIVHEHLIFKSQARLKL